MIDIEFEIEYWKSGAISEIETAEILFANNKFGQGLFYCHLSIEKILKALIVKNIEDIPPFTHNLYKLFEKVKIEIPEESSELIGILMKYQQEGRYPSYHFIMPSNIECQKIFSQTKDLLSWLTNKL